MADVRVDPQTGDWRIIAPGRAARPVDRVGAGPACPFCPGHEWMTPPEVLRVPAGESRWRIRVVPNLFAFVTPDGVSAGEASPDAAVAGVESFPGTGQHEVLIESDRHDWDLRDASPAQAEEILHVARQRCRAFGARRPAAVVVFRNYGAAAGNSLRHPHSQLVALDQAPPGLVHRWRHAQEHHARTGRRLHADVAAAERAAGVRVVADTDGVLVFQPAAASMPHETILLPDDDAADLAGASDDALAAVARTLPRVLSGLATVLDDPAYNLVVHAGPAGEPDAPRWYRWQISLYPRTTTPAGLEFATGLTINPAAPEETAAVLRRAIEGPL